MTSLFISRIIITIALLYALQVIWTKNIDLISWAKTKIESLLPINEDISAASITLYSAILNHKEKLPDGQYNFDIKFKIINAGQNHATNFKHLIIFTDKQKKFKDFEFVSNNTLEPYSVSKKQDVVNLTNVSSNFLLNYPYCILFVEYLDAKNNKRDGKIFFRKIFYEKDKNIISTNLSFLTKEEEREIIKLLHQNKKEYIESNKIFKRTLEE